MLYKLPPPPSIRQTQLAIHSSQLIDFKSLSLSQHKTHAPSINMASSSKSFVLFIALIFLTADVSFGARHLLQTTMPSIPTLPTIPTLPMPTSLPLPSMPTIPTTLPQPTLPTLPTTLPTLPTATLPPLPSMPTVPTTLPPMPSIPSSLPKIPSIPFLTPPPASSP